VFDDKIDVVYPNSTDFTNKYSALLKKADPVLNNIRYKVSSDYVPKTILDCIPCTTCQVFEECDADNNINPQNCKFMKEFLKMF